MTSELTYLDGIILGAVQGLTEFLPISSSAHLAVVQSWLRLDPEGLHMHVFDGVSHIGTVMAMLLVFFSSFRNYLGRLIAELRPDWPGRRYALRFALLGVIASIPTAIIGLAFKKHFEQSFGDAVEVGGGLVITGAMLIGTSLAPRGRKGWKQFSWWNACLIGIAQGISISPGISRSGATICTGTLCGIRRRWAAEFSFFIAIPAILGATALKLREAFAEHEVSVSAIAWGPTLVGGLVAFIIGVISLKLLLDAVRRAKLHHFAWYCFVVGVFIMAKVF
jgi:undecaprenyl-diphosphatase